MLFCVAPVGAFADAPTGGATYTPPPPPPPDPSTVPLGQPQPIVPGVQAVLLPDGTAAAPADAPPQVQNAVWAANTIQTCRTTTAAATSPSSRAAATTAPARSPSP